MHSLPQDSFLILYRLLQLNLQPPVRLSSGTTSSHTWRQEVGKQLTNDYKQDEEEVEENDFHEKEFDDWKIAT